MLQVSAALALRFALPGGAYALLYTQIRRSACSQPRCGALLPATSTQATDTQGCCNSCGHCMQDTAAWGYMA